MTREKALERIKKCLALGESGNEHEAAQALRNAQALMKKYGISKESVSFSEFGQQSTERKVAKKVPPHIASLASVIADAFGVKPAIGCDQRLSFYGPSMNVTVAAYSFDVCARALSQARRHFLKTVHKNCKASTRTRRADQFCLGWVFSVKSNLPTLDITEDESRELERYIQSELGELTNASTRSARAANNKDHLAFHRGLMEGHEFEVRHGVNGGSTVHCLLSEE